MTRPIILWQSDRTTSTDDAGVTILKSTNPPHEYFQPGPYSDKDNPGIAEIRVPPLSYFCIKCLIQAPESIYHYGPPRPYLAPESPGDSDILQCLIPRTAKGHSNLAKVDPRLWAILVQIYSDLPHCLRAYRTALSDKYIPLLQRVPTTEYFTLLTVLELPGCSHLNDDTIIHLTALHTLCALDASHSTLSALGVRRLSGTLKLVEDGVDCANRRRGPWQLRILSLHHCKRVNNAVYQHLEPFILLTAVDLRGTSCTWDREKIPPSFYPAVDKRLYYPASPLEALSLLLDSQGLIPSSDFGVLHIDQLTHASRKRSRKSGHSLDIGSSIVAADSNTALPACHMANFPPDLDDSPCSPERAPSLRRLPHLHLPDEPLQKSSMESGEAILRAMHDVIAEESNVYEARHKAKMFYSQSTGSTSSSTAHPPRNMPQWGQELLMLYREPPPWDQALLPPVVKAASRPRSLGDLVSVDRMNERTMKGVQDMRDILSERHRLVKKETDGSCSSKKVSTKSSASRNPFAVRLGKPSTPAHQRANEETSTSQNADTVTKSTVVTPQTSRSLRPISSLPVPIPPDSFIPVPELDSGQAACGPGRRRDSDRNRRSISLQNNGYHDRRVDRSLSRTNGRRGADRAEPVVARKRTRTASVSGSKGFDWSSWAR